MDNDDIGDCNCINQIDKSIIQNVLIDELERIDKNLGKLKIELTKPEDEFNELNVAAFDLLNRYAKPRISGVLERIKNVPEC